MSQLTAAATASSMGAVVTLTGNSGGAVSPTLGNINVVGSGSVNIVGNPGTSTLTVSVTDMLSYTSVNTTPYVVLTTDDYISVDSSGGAITIELPNTLLIGRVFHVKDKTGSAATHNITVTTVGGAINIDGATSFIMNTNFESIAVIWGGSAYEVF